CCRPRCHQQDMLLSNFFLRDNLESGAWLHFPEAVSTNRPLLPAAAVLLDEIDQARPLEIAGRRQGDVRSDVSATEIVVHLIALQRADAVDRAEHAVTKLVGAVEYLPRLLVGDVARLILVLADFLNDHFLFGREVLDAQAWPKDVGEDIDRLR